MTANCNVCALSLTFPSWMAQSARPGRDHGPGGSGRPIIELARLLRYDTAGDTRDISPATQTIVQEINPEN